jgi:Protein of unknown function (DUF3631)
MAVDVVGLFMALLSFVESAPQAYRLKASNAAPPFSTSAGTSALADLHTVFAEASELTSKVILSRLLELPESPWNDIRGKPLDDRGLAKRLRPYGIKPKNIRIGPATPRGYVRADLEDVWRRYLPPSPQNSKTGKTSKTSQDKQAPVLDVLDVLDLRRNGGGAARGHRCDQCGAGGETQEVHYGDASAWLHRVCEAPWKAACDLEIPPFLDRRGSPH